MSVRISTDLSGLNSMLSGQRLQRAQYVLVNQAMADMDKFVPYKQGHLSTQVAIGLDGKSIVYTVPYARAQFYGVVGGKYPVQHYTKTVHPEATKRWDLKAKSLYGDEWANKVAKKLMEGK